MGCDCTWTGKYSLGRTFKVVSFHVNLKAKGFPQCPLAVHTQVWAQIPLYPTQDGKGHLNWAVQVPPVHRRREGPWSCGIPWSQALGHLLRALHLVSCEGTW